MCVEALCRGSPLISGRLHEDSTHTLTRPGNVNLMLMQAWNVGPSMGTFMSYRLLIMSCWTQKQVTKDALNCAPCMQSLMNAWRIESKKVCTQAACATCQAAAA